MQTEPHNCISECVISRQCACCICAWSEYCKVHIHRQFSDTDTISLSKKRKAFVYDMGKTDEQ